jgi:hypothetical protein
VWFGTDPEPVRPLPKFHEWVSVGVFSSVEPLPSNEQTFWSQVAVKLATGAALPAGAVTVTWTSRGTAWTWS